MLGHPEFEKARGSGEREQPGELSVLSGGKVALEGTGSQRMFGLGP